jgi:hypothetical protein
MIGGFPKQRVNPMLEIPCLILFNRQSEPERDECHAHRLMQPRVNAKAEVASTADRPRTAAVKWAYPPRLKPTAAMKPVFRP